MTRTAQETTESVELTEGADQVRCTNYVRLGVACYQLVFFPIFLVDQLFLSSPIIALPC